MVFHQPSDLKVVRNISDRVAVMYLGRIVEEASSDEVFAKPLHPCAGTRVKCSCRTPLSDRASFCRGEPPNPAAPASGCAFHPPAAVLPLRATLVRYLNSSTCQQDLSVVIAGHADGRYSCLDF